MIAPRACLIFRAGTDHARRTPSGQVSALLAGAGGQGTALQRQHNSDVAVMDRQTNKQTTAKNLVDPEASSRGKQTRTHKQKIRSSAIVLQLAQLESREQASRTRFVGLFVDLCFNFFKKSFSSRRLLSYTRGPMRRNGPTPSHPKATKGTISVIGVLIGSRPVRNGAVCPTIGFRSSCRPLWTLLRRKAGMGHRLRR